MPEATPPDPEALPASADDPAIDKACDLHEYAVATREQGDFEQAAVLARQALALILCFVSSSIFRRAKAICSRISERSRANKAKPRLSDGRFGRAASPHQPKLVIVSLVVKVFFG